MSKRKATTAHGEIEYETIPCENCDNDVLKEEAVPVHLDPKSKRCNEATICGAEHPYPRQESTLCLHCAKSIFGYERKGFWNSQETITRLKWDLASVALICLTTVISPFFISIILDIVL